MYACRKDAMNMTSTCTAPGKIYLFGEHAAVYGMRGTAEVDSEFLKEIESWREMLAKNIALRNPDVSIYELNYAVQKIIDRVIFLRICEDRGIEPYGQLQSAAESTGVYTHLLNHFKLAELKYNSGIFNFGEDGVTPRLRIDDKVLKMIIGSLYYPISPYELSVLGVEILGDVYGQFLGKVIKLTAGHPAKVATKPEVKKAGGVYYTPQYIVDYIVGKAVVSWLRERRRKRLQRSRYSTLHVVREVFLSVRTHIF